MIPTEPLSPEQKKLFDSLVASDSSIASYRKRISMLRTRLRTHLEAYHRKAADIQMQIAYCQKRINLVETYLRGDILKGKRKRRSPNTTVTTTIPDDPKHQDSAAP